jgi:hypothetical protein
VRKEFLKTEDKSGPSPTIFSMPEPPKQGWMEKQNDREKWQKRSFVLVGRNLSYFKSPADALPKGRMDVTTITIRVPENSQSQERRFEFQIVTPDRNMTVATATVEEMFSWIHAIRRSRLYYEKVDTKSDSKIPPAAKVSARDVAKSVKSGKLKKQGDTLKMWGDKWIVLTDDTLFWFKKKPERDEEESEGGIKLIGCDVVTTEEKSGKKTIFHGVNTGEKSFLSNIK